MERGSGRRPGPLPLRAILLFLAVVIVLRVASAWPAVTVWLHPEILGAALFLYTPFLHYRRGRPPAWTAPGDRGTGFRILAGTAAAGAAVYLAASRLPGVLPPPLPPEALPPLWEFLVRQALFVALPEEVFFRGYLYDAFEERGWEPVLSSSLLFSAGHLVIHASPYRALTFFPALLFGWARKRTGGIYVPILLHFLFNLFPYLRAAL
ncbi:MAG TPA: hypothetical protein DD658_02135 [Deltaproteobacteria bacterium]|nr:MAG: hypothetical protein A2X88_09170 [Deltaproteobacteria bacterium GWC2_65_14]HBO68992.1 hypothetical protein [Deltaproteobacteria bacterium]